MDLSNTSAKTISNTTSNTISNDDAQNALDILAEAWAYYTPAPVLALDDAEPDLFQYYASAA